MSDPERAPNNPPPRPPAAASRPRQIMPRSIRLAIYGAMAVVVLVAVILERAEQAPVRVEQVNLLPPGAGNQAAAHAGEVGLRIVLSRAGYPVAFLVSADGRPSLVVPSGSEPAVAGREPVVIPIEAAAWTSSSGTLVVAAARHPVAADDLARDAASLRTGLADAASVPRAVAALLSARVGPARVLGIGPGNP